MSAIDANDVRMAEVWKQVSILVLLISISACSDDATPSPPVLSGIEASEMLNRHACNACHEIDELRIGPSFRDIALRYNAEDDDPEERLIQKIIHGGAGSWGAVPMVSNPRMPEEDVRQIVRWIMSLESSSQ